MKKSFVCFILLFSVKAIEAKTFLAFDNNKEPIYYASVTDGKSSVFNFLNKEEYSFKFNANIPLYIGFKENSDTLNVSFSSGGIFSCGIYTKKCSCVYSPSEKIVFSYFLPSANQFITQSDSGKVDFIDASSYKVAFSTEIKPEITAFALDREKKNFIAGLSDGNILLWSVMGRGILAKTAIAVQESIIYVREFSYSEILSGFDDKNPDFKKIKQKSGILAVSSGGIFYIFSLDKRNMKYYLELLSEYKSELDFSFKPVDGLSSSDYIVFSNPYGKLYFFAFRAKTISYKDKEFDNLAKGLDISEEIGLSKFKIILPEIEKRNTEELELKEPSYIVISPNGKYLLCANEKGDVLLKKNPIIEKMFNNIIERADAAVQSQKYDLAITLYSRALGLYPDESIEKSREKVWELKKRAEADRLEKMKNLSKGNGK